MKRLPERPSLGYLRKEAKDLLSELRESRPTATLSDAQRALAESYGFENWTQLKAEAERVRSFATTVDGSDIADAFGLGTVSGPLTLVRDQHMGGVWSLQTESGRWMVRPVFDWFDETHASPAVALMQAAGQAGVGTPTAVRSPRCNLVERVGGRSWRVDEWMELAPPARRSSAHAAAVGRALATLHHLRIPDDRAVQATWGRRTESDWRALLAFAREIDEPIARLLQDALPALVELEALPGELPSSDVELCHRNVQPNHVRINGHGDVVLLHWEFAGPLTPSAELAATLVNWSLGRGEEVNERAARSFLEAYGASRPLQMDDFAWTILQHVGWIANRIRLALFGQTPEDRQTARRELPALLRPPRTRAAYERLVALSAAAHKEAR